MQKAERFIQASARSVEDLNLSIADRIPQTRARAVVIVNPALAEETHVLVMNK